ncbi:hypothetical protein [Paracraurococcus lichenis]|uniref:Uncharacterized protein n=1 Tax=Paracraurococcus lichenis TaxID=3064888 RepID=A0ABT9E4G5_9PROT|nr:hypothetical protein [Paracraurococcus sp. LOR1-02]MDO9711038.1 hypothetical protein [Paracraurococcus sp. LOR1-02]
MTQIQDVEPYDLTIIQGDTFTWQGKICDEENEVLTPVDLTGYTAAMHIRHRITDAVPLITLTTENGRIILGGTEGTITLMIADEDTATLPPCRAVYDLKLAVSGGVFRFMGGACFIEGSVTR